LLFNQELLALLEAGLSIVEALETLLEKEARAETRHVLKAVVTRLHEGQSLSASLESQGVAFPPLYVAAIRSSERSGSLVESLTRYIGYQMQVDQMRKKIIAASIYPALLMLVGGLVVMFLLIYVIPKFSHIYADTGRELPLASWLLMKWGEMIESHGGMLTSIFLGGLALAVYALSRSDVRGWLRELLWRFPFIGDRMRIYQLSRFYRSLGMLVSAGIPLMPAMDQVSGLLDVRLQARLAVAKNHIREGQSLSQSMESSGLSTPVALRLLRVGERTGQMGGMMNRIADFHEEELNRWIDWASRLFEPLLMTFIGVVIGAIVVLMYIPIFELAGSIQ
jgi:general secretion pathway protein F